MRKKEYVVGSRDSFQNRRRRRRGGKKHQLDKKRKKGVEQDKRRIQK